VIYSEAFRAPSYFETNFTDNQTVIPNPTLHPETVQSGEVSFEQRLGTQRLFVGGFDAQYSDMVLEGTAPLSAIESAVTNGTLAVPRPDTPKSIMATYVGNVSQNQNLSGIEDIGVNAAFEGTLFSKDLRYGVNFTWAYARQTGPNPAGSGPCPGSQGIAQATCTLPLPVAPAVFGNARLSYDLPGEWPVLGVAGSLVGKRPADHAFDEGWTPVPYAPTQFELRGTISGRVPGLPGLSYRFIVDYAFAAVNPYIIGPVSAPQPSNPTPELVPVDQLRTTVGLQYDLR
jgi:outer membrane receptor protein involved in Fe transport